MALSSHRKLYLDRDICDKVESSKRLVCWHNLDGIELTFLMLCPQDQVLLIVCYNIRMSLLDQEWLYISIEQ